MTLPLPRSPLGWSIRCGVSIAIAATGVALSLSRDHYWQSKIPPIRIVGGGYPPITAPTFNSVTGDLLFAAMPFFALAVATLLFGVRVFALLAVPLLGLLTVWEYRTNAHDTSSTAGLVFLWSWVGGGFIVAAAVGIDEAVRHWRSAPVVALTSSGVPSEQRTGDPHEAEWALRVAGLAPIQREAPGQDPQDQNREP
jgi:hypothetical protein